MTSRTWLRLLAVPMTAVAGFLAQGRWSGSPPPPEDPPSGRAPEHWVQGVGYVEPATEVRRLAFKTSGVIAACRVAVGDALNRGAVVMSLDDQEQRAAVAVAEAELAVARAEQAKVLAGVNPYRIAAAESRVQMLKAQLAYARKEYDRTRHLAPAMAVSDSDFDKARTERNRDEAALHEAEAEVLHLKRFVLPEDRQVAEAQVQRAAARLRLARQQLEDMTLRAPCDGTVLELIKHAGDGVRFADNEPVAIFGDLSRLRVRAEIEERYVRGLKAGQRAVAYGRGLGKEEFAGRITQIKGVMGKKTVFSRAATERKDLDVLQVFLDLGGDFTAPIGLEVDVRIAMWP